MKSFKQIIIFTSIVLSLLATSLVNAAGVGNNIVVRLVGTDTAYGGDALFEEYGVDLPVVEALCFDLKLIDAKTGNEIGTATDCLSDISGDKVVGMELTGTTFFFFPGGTLVSLGFTTVQPILHGHNGFTHITGALPGVDSVLYGDRKFKNAYGPVRLSGAVNLDALGSSSMITFDCVFIIDI